MTASWEPEIHRAQQQTRAELRWMIGIGVRVLVEEPGRRVYAQQKGHAVGAPLFLGKFSLNTIREETSRSWVLSGGKKIPKGSLAGLVTQEDLDDLIWVEVHRAHCTGIRFNAWLHNAPRDEVVALLKTIAAAIGYDPTAQGGG